MAAATIAAASKATQVTTPAVVRGLAVQVPCLTAENARMLDERLMASPGFSVDQLMELAGLAVAQATFSIHSEANPASRVAVLAGPGNNGGDALVAARHLRHFGFQPSVFYPRMSGRDEAQRLYGNLLKQLEDLDVPVHRDETAAALSAAELDRSFDVVLDGLFGFSFRGPPRAPFDGLIAALAGTTCPLVSIDVPSGWHVDDGPQPGMAALQPQVLVSLTAPKPCVRHFAGQHHVLGGRFVPPRLASQFGIEGIMGLYAGIDQTVHLGPGESAEDA